MATAADWVTNIYEPQWQTFEELEAQATELVICVDEVADTSSAAWGEDSAVTEMVVACIVLMMDNR